MRSGLGSPRGVKIRHFDCRPKPISALVPSDLHHTAFVAQELREVNSRRANPVQMSSRLEELQERVIALQLELRRLERRRRRLKKNIDSELDKLLRAKEILNRSRRIDV